MKTFFVCDEKRLGNHAGEEYDQYVKVPHDPTTENIDECADRIKQFLRELWVADKNTEERKVVVTIDAASSFHLMLRILQVSMKEDEAIIVELPNCGVPAE